MSDRNAAEGDGSSAPAIKQGASKSASEINPGTATADDNNVSQVLRSVYQRAVEEAIPDEMLDLLSKLD